MAFKVLIVEDESHIRRVAANYFEQAGFDVVQAQDGKCAKEIFEDNHIDLVILDVMLPILDGWSFLKWVRERSKVLVIMITALEDERDKLKGFSHGADEYVTKPFSPKVLVARASALLKRNTGNNKGDIIEINGITIDKKSRSVKNEKKLLELTPKEYIMLEYLMENPNQALSREQIITKIWGYDYFGETRVVDTHVKNLRKKLGDIGECIATVTGIGYKFEVSG